MMSETRWSRLWTEGMLCMHVLSLSTIKVDFKVAPKLKTQKKPNTKHSKTKH